MGHIPVRTCLACRRADAQRSLVRLTVVDGDIVVDRADRRSGRGAYLCPTTECFDAALRRDGAALRRALGRGHGPRRIDRDRLTAQWRAVTQTTTVPDRRERRATAEADDDSVTAAAGNDTADAGKVSLTADAVGVVE